MFDCQTVAERRAYAVRARDIARLKRAQAEKAFQRVSEQRTVIVDMRIRAEEALARARMESGRSQ